MNLPIFKPTQDPQFQLESKNGEVRGQPRSLPILCVTKKCDYVLTHLIRVFKQQFLVFLEIYVGKKACGNTCNVV